MHGIAATTCAPNHIDIFYLDPDFAMAHKSWDGTQWHFGWDKLGGIFTSVPAAVASRARPPSTGTADPSPAAVNLACRVDVFGLGLDYAMYHQTIWNGVPAQNPQWSSLGGIFTSAPAAVAWQGGRIDVFGLGLDRAMYRKFWNGAAWSNQWERLGGTFSSEASVVSWAPNRIDVFVRGADYTLRHRGFNQTAPLTDWENLGGSLASAPAAVSWEQDRLDIFAVGHDGALWHRWWDGSIWNDWESLGGNFSAAPSAVAWGPNRLDVFVTGAVDGAVYHFWWSDETWYGPESFGGSMTSAPTAISVAPSRLNVLAPGTDQNIYHRAFNLAVWNPVLWEQLGGHMTLPTRYRFSVDFVTVDTARSFNSDTDFAQCSIRAGNWPIRTTTQSMGDLGGTAPKQAQTNLLNFEPVAVDLCEPVVFNYSVINNGHADQSTMDAFLTKAGESLFESLTDFDGPLVEWLLDQFFSVVFADCDGWVVVDQHTLVGRDVHLQTANGPYTVTKTYDGTDSPTGCGANSKYELTWSIKRA